MSITFSATVSAAEKYRCAWPVEYATISVEAASAAPCQAKRWIRVRTRRCDSIANASSSRNAASRLTTWPERDVAISAPYQEVDQHAEHRQEEGGGEELGRKEQPQLSEQGLDQRQNRAGKREFRVNGELAMRERLDDGGELRRAGDERRREQRHQHCRLGEEPDQHLAARAEAAERRADVHRGERREYPRQREHADQRDDIGRRRERQVGREHRNNARSEPHATGQYVRRKAEQRRGVARHDRVLVEQLGQRVIGQQDRRRRAGL